MKELSATLKNLTPHTVMFIDAAGMMFAIQPEPVSARVGEKRIRLATVIDGGMLVPIYRKSWDREGATGIPPKDGTLYIVSTVIAEAFPERDDFLVPDEIERTEEGLIVGAHALAQMWPASNQVAKEYLERARAGGPPPRTASEG